MPVSFDVETQLKIDQVVKGSKFDASLNKLIRDVNKELTKVGSVKIHKVDLGNVASVWKHELDKAFSQAIPDEVLAGLSRQLSEKLKLDAQVNFITSSGDFKKLQGALGTEVSDKELLPMLKRVYAEKLKQERELIRLTERLEKEKQKRLAKSQSDIVRGAWSDLGIDRMFTGGLSPKEIGEPSEMPASGKKNISRVVKVPVPGGGYAFGKRPAGSLVPAAPSPLAASPAGGGAMSAAKMGAIVGGVAAAVLLLADVIKKGIKQSQIASAATDFLSKLMGLLVDLILLPFLPILIFAMFLLIKGIITFGKFWKEFWDTGAGKTLIDWLKAVAEALAPILEPLAQGAADLADGIMKLLTGKPLNDDPNKPNLYSHGTLGGSAFGMPDFQHVVGAVVAGLLTALGVALLASVGGWAALIIGAFAAVIAFVLMPIAYEWGASFGHWIAGALYELGKAWEEFLKGVGEIFDAIKNLPSTVSAMWEEWTNRFRDGIDQIIQSIASFLPSLGGFWEEFKAAVSAGLKGLVNAAINIVNLAFKGLRIIPGLNAFVPSDIPMLDTGGRIEKTGIAVVHKGETVVPAGSGENKTMNFNFYGYQDDALVRKVRELMRQDASRYRL